jgi:squalene-hopene/tetraprenyl-beta-curcumene cyclase
MLMDALTVDLPPAVDGARSVARGVAALRALQRPDGRWVSDPDMGPVGLAIGVLCLRWLEALLPEERRGAQLTLRAAQREDGGFPIRPYAPESTLGATAVCRAAMRAAGIPDHDPAVVAAEACIAALGGYPRLLQRMKERGEPAPMFCAMVGLVPGEVLPNISPDAAALPWSERFLDGRMHAGIPTVFYAIAAVRERLCGHHGLLPAWTRGPTRLLARRRLTSFLAQFQNQDGSWNASTYNTIFALIALQGVGVNGGDEAMRRGLAFLRTRRRWQGEALQLPIFDGDTWETAFCSLALSACGVPGSDEAIVRAQAHLFACQSRALQPRVNQPKAGAPRTGGFPFQLGNDTMPDCDDTAVAIAALSAAAGARPTRQVHAVVAEAMAWMGGMQNESGGFPSYVHGLPDKPPGPTFYQSTPLPFDDPAAVLRMLASPPPDLGDPPTADVAGRCLWAFGFCELGPAHPLVARTLRFLQRDVCEDGSFWGIWSPPYVVPTSFVLLGLAAVQADLRGPLVQRALRWLLSKQNADGGWGDPPEAFFKPELAGLAPSMAPATGVALAALAELTEAGVGSPEIEAAADRAAAWLIRRQREDGTWPEDGFVFTIVPPTHYRWELAHLYYVLIGLGRWTRRRADGAGAGACQ